LLRGGEGGILMMLKARRRHRTRAWFEALGPGVVVGTVRRCRAWRCAWNEAGHAGGHHARHTHVGSMVTKQWRCWLCSREGRLRKGDQETWKIRESGRRKHQRMIRETGVVERERPELCHQPFIDHFHLHIFVLQKGLNTESTIFDCPVGGARIHLPRLPGSWWWSPTARWWLKWKIGVIPPLSQAVERT
jgi:hypothetical protein